MRPSTNSELPTETATLQLHPLLASKEANLRGDDRGQMLNKAGGVLFKSSSKALNLLLFLNLFIPYPALGQLPLRHYCWLSKINIQKNSASSMLWLEMTCNNQPSRNSCTPGIATPTKTHKPSSLPGCLPFLNAVIHLNIGTFATIYPWSTSVGRGTSTSPMARRGHRKPGPWRAPTCGPCRVDPGKHVVILSLKQNV